MIVVEAELWRICFCSASPEGSLPAGRYETGKGAPTQIENRTYRIFSGLQAKYEIVCPTSEAALCEPNRGAPLQQATYLVDFFVVGGFFFTPLVSIRAK